MKKSLWTFIVLSLAFNMLGGELSGRGKMVWAHYTPWHVPLNASSNIANYYNFPDQRNSGNAKVDFRREIELAMAQGIDGFFNDVVAQKSGGTSAFIGATHEMLQAAEGTEFQVGICLDVKTTVPQQVRELKTMLDLFGKHPNYPKFNGRPVVCTYTFASWTPEEWKEIIAGLKKEGHEMYIVANFEKGYTKYDPEQIRKYLDVIDMGYAFMNTGINGKSEKDNVAILTKTLKEGGKPFMGTLYPGYYGAWLNGRNDFYQPHMGFDQMQYCFETLTTDMPWVHCTTWNDHDETSIMPMVFTPGNAGIVRAYSDRFKGIKNLPAVPQLHFAYHREEIPGTLLRIEAMNLPNSAGKVTVSGRLLDERGRKIADLAEKTLDSQGFDRVEWLVPTVELAKYPAWIPEITAVSGNYRKTAKLPAIFPVNSHLQNAVTVKVALNDCAELKNTLSIREASGVLTASVNFDSPVAVKHAALWRNDRPIGEFSPETDGKTLLNLQVISGTDFELETSGKIVRAIRRFQNVGSDKFTVGNQSVKSVKNIAWESIGVQLAVKPDDVIIFKFGKDGIRFSAAELNKRGYVSYAGVKIKVLPADITLMNAVELKQKSGKFTTGFLSRPPQPYDRFFIRYELADGSTGYSDVVFPFAAGQPMIPANLVQTPVNLETSSGASGMPGRSEYFSKELPISVTEVVSAELHPATVRGSRWSFNGNGLDELGDWNIVIPEAQLIDGKYVRFAGKNGLKMPLRTWPLGNTTIELKIKPEPGIAEKQSIIKTTGWSDGLDLNLLPDGKVEVNRRAGDKVKVQTLVSKAALKPGEWNLLRIINDSKNIRIHIDGAADAELAVPPLRSYGNSTWFLGSSFHGELDQLTVLGIAAAPGSPGYPGEIESAVLPPVRSMFEPAVAATPEKTAKSWLVPETVTQESGDPAAVAPAAEKIAKPVLIHDSANNIALQVGPGPAGANLELTEFKLENNTQLLVPFQSFERLEGKKGWTAILVSLANGDKKSVNFNIGNPDNLLVTVNEPQWKIKGGPFPLSRPAALKFCKYNGNIILYLGDRRIYIMADDPTSPYDTLKISVTRQYPEAAVCIKLGAPELYSVQ